MQHIRDFLVIVGYTNYFLHLHYLYIGGVIRKHIRGLKNCETTVCKIETVTMQGTHRNSYTPCSTSYVRMTLSDF